MMRILIVLTFFLSLKSSATHINGGYITYQRIDNLTVLFTFVGYRNQEGVLFGQGRFDFGDGEIFGDEEGEAIPWTNIILLANGAEQWEFSLLHTYASTGAPTVSYTEDFRTTNVRNISSSGESSFHVESKIVLDPLTTNGDVGTNPRTLPLTTAIAGSRMYYSFGFENEDDDSIRIEIVTPLQEKDTSIPDYKLPNSPQFYGLPSDRLFEIDHLNGELVWDVPTITGFYSLAFKVEEWKKIGGENVLMGHRIFEYLVEVKSTNERASIEVPDFACYSEADNFSEVIVIENPDEKVLEVYLYADFPFLFDGLTEDEWNNSSFVSSAARIEILVETEFDLSSGPSLINLMTTEVIGSWQFDQDSREQPYSITKSFGVGFECDVAELELITGIPLPLEGMDLTVLKDQITIKSDLNQNLEAFLYDLQGNLLGRSQRVEGSQISIDYSAVSGMVYLLQIRNGDEFYLKKFIFQ